MNVATVHSIKLSASRKLFQMVFKGITGGWHSDVLMCIQALCCLKKELSDLE